MICDCDLLWFSVWLDNLKDQSDEVMSKKKTICTMPMEHREYLIQKMPAQKLGCSKFKSYERALSMSGTKYITYGSTFIIIIAFTM